MQPGKLNANIKINVKTKKGGLHRNPPYHSFNYSATHNAQLSSYCTVNVIVVEFNSGANAPVTVSV
jgi:hypothetical protein